MAGGIWKESAMVGSTTHGSAEVKESRVNEGEARERAAWHRPR